MSNSRQPLEQTPGGFVERSVLKLAHALIPRRTKRLILYASLTALLKQQSELDRQTLEKLNQVMGLTTETVDAMNLPVKLRVAIWKGSQPIRIPDTFFTQQPNEQDLQSTLAELIAKIPAWLRYGKDTELKADVQRYLMHSGDYLDRRRLARS